MLRAFVVEVLLDVPFRRKLESLSFPRRLGASEKKAEVVDGRKVSETVTHWDGRQDATVHPDVIRYGTKIHGTGKKRGKVAEVYEMDAKERRSKHGDGG